MNPFAYGISHGYNGFFTASLIKRGESIPKSLGSEKIPNTPINRNKLRDIISTALSSTNTGGYERCNVNLPLESVVGILVPHMNFTNGRSPLAACIISCQGYRLLNANCQPKRFILLGVNHFAFGAEFAVCPPSWLCCTLLGEIETDVELISELCSISYLRVDGEAFRKEEGFYPHLAPLQYLFGSFNIVPILFSGNDFEKLVSIGREMGQIVKERFPNTYLVTVSDLIHYLLPSRSFIKLKPVIKAIEEMNSVDFHKTVLEDRISMDGVSPAIVAMEAAKVMGATKGLMLDFGYTFSDSVAEHRGISHGSFAFLRE
jgi:AmmeMemoRadiSam system protein B